LQRSTNAAESEMLLQGPPPWFVRSTAWLLMAKFGAALFSAVLIKLSEGVARPFVALLCGPGCAATFPLRPQGRRPNDVERRDRSLPRLAAFAATGSGAPVVLLGETGTGKTLLAHAIHNSSARAAEGGPDSSDGRN
jgi:hypothetical protein